MTSSQNTRVLVIGVGNPFRSDDAAGLCVARLIKQEAGHAAAVMEHSGEGASLIETWKDASAVILIDAVSSGAAPGTVHCLDPLIRPLPREMFRYSTHAFSIPEAVELGRALQQLPRHLLVIGIEGRNFEAGTELSPEVAAGLGKAVALVLQEIRKFENDLQPRG